MASLVLGREATDVGLGGEVADQEVDVAVAGLAANLVHCGLSTAGVSGHRHHRRALPGELPRRHLADAGADARDHTDPVFNERMGGRARGRVKGPRAVAGGTLRGDMSDETLFGWIHISDIHFGHGDAAHGWDQKLVMAALRRDIAGKPTPVRVDAMLVTGDLAFSGAGRSPGEYADAKAWLLAAGPAAGLGPESIFLVPGNHDVNRNVDSANKSIGRLVKALRSRSTPEASLDDALKDADDRRLLAARLKGYLELAKDFGPWVGRQPLPPEAEQLYWVHTLDDRGGLRVRLIGLNTALLCRDDEDMGQLRLGNEQLAQALAADRAPNEVILALSHHPLRKGWLGDEGSADAWIRNNAHAHLSGHVHEQESEAARSGAGGSFVRVTAGAAHNEQLPAWIPATHGYNFGELRRGAAGKVLLPVHPRLSRSPAPNRQFVLDVHAVPRPRGAEPQQTFAEHEIGVTMPVVVTPAAAASSAGAPRVDLPATDPVRVFVSFAPKDEAAQQDLFTALASARRGKLVELHASRHAGPTTDGVDPELVRAHLILLLLSPDYLASDYCYDVEDGRGARPARRGSGGGDGRAGAQDRRGLVHQGLPAHRVGRARGDVARYAVALALRCRPGSEQQAHARGAGRPRHRRLAQQGRRLDRGRAGDSRSDQDAAREAGLTGLVAGRPGPDQGVQAGIPAFEQVGRGWPPSSARAHGMAKSMLRFTTVVCCAAWSVHTWGCTPVGFWELVDVACRLAVGGHDDIGEALDEEDGGPVGVGGDEVLVEEVVVERRAPDPRSRRPPGVGRRPRLQMHASSVVRSVGSKMSPTCSSLIWR